MKNSSGFQPGVKTTTKRWSFLPASIQRLNAGFETGRLEMLERCDLETTVRQTISTRPSLSLTWCLDPATGKLVSGWVVQQPESSSSLALREAA